MIAHAHHYLSDSLQEEVLQSTRSNPHRFTQYVFRVLTFFRFTWILGENVPRDWQCKPEDLLREWCVGCRPIYGTYSIIICNYSVL